MDDYRILPVKPTGEQLQRMREIVGWGRRDASDIQRGLDGSLFAVCALLGDEVVGTARVVGDGRSAFYVQDVIVLPEHRGRGLGRAIMDKVMEYIASVACDGAVIGLMAAPGKESFYARFGFASRPDARHGAGMTQFWNAI